LQKNSIPYVQQAATLGTSQQEFWRETKKLQLEGKISVPPISGLKEKKMKSANKRDQSHKKQKKKKSKGPGGAKPPKGKEGKDPTVALKKKKNRRTGPNASHKMGNNLLTIPKQPSAG